MLTTAHNRPHPSGLNRHQRRAHEAGYRAKLAREARWFHERRRTESFRMELAVDASTGLVYPRGERLPHGGSNVTPRDPEGPARRHAMKARRGQRGA